MHKARYHSDNCERLLVNINELCSLLSLGVGTSKKIAELANARVDLGSAKIVRYNVAKIREYLEMISF